MFFVVMGHLYKGGSVFFKMIELIKMPLFYFLAGYVFRPGKNWRTFLKGLFFHIYIPYLIFSLLPLKSLLFLIRGDTAALLDYLASFFSGKIFWFIPSFLLTQIFVYLLHRVFTGNTKLIAAASVLCFFIGISSADTAWMDFWCIDTALTTVLYMNFGFLMKQCGDLLHVSSSKAIAINAAIYLCGAVCTVRFYPECTMDVHLNSYYNIPLCLIMIFSGICLSMGISQRLPWGKAAGPWLSFGQETLIVYLTHGAVQFALSILLRKVLPLNNESFWNSLFYSILVCFVGTAASKAIGRFIPELVGKKRNPMSKLPDKPEYP